MAIVAAFVHVDEIDNNEAREVTQEVFLRAMRKIHQLREPERFIGWLKRDRKDRRIELGDEFTERFPVARASQLNQRDESGVFHGVPPLSREIDYREHSILNRSFDELSVTGEFTILCSESKGSGGHAGESH